MVFRGADRAVEVTGDRRTLYFCRESDGISLRIGYPARLKQGKLPVGAGLSAAPEAGSVSEPWESYMSDATESASDGIGATPVRPKRDAGKAQAAEQPFEYPLKREYVEPDWKRLPGYADVTRGRVGVRAVAARTHGQEARRVQESAWGSPQRRSVRRHRTRPAESGPRCRC